MQKNSILTINVIAYYLCVVTECWSWRW